MSEATTDQALSSEAQQLSVIFPSLEHGTIQAVLDAHNGSVESATETLLQMSSPDHKPSEMQTQIDTDAQLARAIAEEDAAAAARSREARSQAQAPAQPQPLAYKPYVPRGRRNTNQGGATDTTSETPVYVPPTDRPKDELDQLSDEFKKLAEEGKKHATQFFSKVKAQIDKLDKPPSSSGAYDAAEGSKAAPTPPPKSTSPSIVPELLPRPDNARPRSASPQSPATTAAVKEATTVGRPAADGSATSSNEPASNSNASTTTATTEPKKDFSKIGLLPRQQISLLDQDRKNGGKKDSDDESEDLEYVRSPFDDD